jgi:nucleotide-binding universal stress UspA family protein
MGKEVREMNRKILVPLDGSELAEKALRYARTPAARIGAEVILLHVCGPEECHCEAEKCTAQPMHRVYVEHTAQMFRNSLEAVAADKIEIGWEILVGDPAAQIVSYAREQNADRIIMASHGRSGIGRWVIGSVADKVARESPVPVVIIRASAEEAERSDMPDSKILVLLDGSDMAEQVLPFAIEHAEMSGRKVVLLRICEPPDIESPFFYHLTRVEYPPTKPLIWDDYVKEVMAKCEDKTKEYLAGIEKRLKDDGLKVSSEILVGKPADEIVDYVGKHSFNLIAMTTHGRSGLTRWAYGSVADRVLHTASCPLLLVRPH